ncbi:MAG TPA: glycosyltransferase N-terminal domain-containing protein [Chitinophagales bacterium]|nr:glycosyltransferase N-terminal domain-containing protein [Chitinophagales bacterium]
MKVLVVVFFVGVIAVLKLLFLQPLIYSVMVRIYGFGIRVASIFGGKARAWVKGRENLFERLQQQVQSGGRKTIWMHCASLGEFEQGRPLLETLKKQHPQAYIVLSFYSPSGFEVRKDYAGADVVTYMPLDTAANASRFIDIIKPDVAIFVKYEFWYHHLKALKSRNIPTYLASGIFRKGQLFFKWYGRLHKDMLRCFTTLFVQEEGSLALLEKIKMTHGVLAFDSRFDRVKEIADKPVSIPLIAQFVEGFNVLVAGSTWPKDERVLQRVFYKSLVFVNFKLILAPHHIEGKWMQRTMKLFKKFSVKYSEAEKLPYEELMAKRIMIIDNMGMLSQLYRYADVNYIGGGLNKGVHNTLEAAVYGKPLIIGPRYKKFHEAVGLVKANAALVITDADDLLNRINLMNQFPFVWKGVGIDAAKYVTDRLGGTETMADIISKKIS